MGNISYKKDYEKVKNLVNVTKYAQKWGLDRSGIYDLLDQGRLTRYVVLEDEYDEKGAKTGNLREVEAFLDLDEVPEVKAWGERDAIKKEE